MDIEVTKNHNFARREWNLEARVSIIEKSESKRVLYKLSLGNRKRQHINWVVDFDFTQKMSGFSRLNLGNPTLERLSQFTHCLLFTLLSIWNHCLRCSHLYYNLECSVMVSANELSDTKPVSVIFWIRKLVDLKLKRG